MGLSSLLGREPPDSHQCPEEVAVVFLCRAVGHREQQVTQQQGRASGQGLRLSHPGVATYTPVITGITEEGEAQMKQG